MDHVIVIHFDLALSTPACLGLTQIRCYINTTSCILCQQGAQKRRLLVMRCTLPFNLAHVLDPLDPSKQAYIHIQPPTIILCGTTVIQPTTSHNSDSTSNDKYWAGTPPESCSTNLRVQKDGWSPILKGYTR